MDLDNRPRINSRDNSAEYQAIHKWVRTELGKANHCSIEPAHEAPVYHWANISHQYKWELSDWQQLCPRCHHKLDERESTREIMRQKSKGNTSRRIPVVQIDTKRKITYYHESGYAAAKAAGILKTSVNNCLRGRIKTAGGYHWRYGRV